MKENVVSAVDFPGSSRIHVGLAVSDLERSKRFYQTLFGRAPTKERPGYAKFEPTDPSVNLSLNQAGPGATSKALPPLRSPSKVIVCGGGGGRALPRCGTATKGGGSRQHAATPCKIRSGSMIRTGTNGKSSW